MKLFVKTTFALLSFAVGASARLSGNATKTNERKLQMSSCANMLNGWYDSEGPVYDCDWYSYGTRCSQYGGSSVNMGMTANQACCVCGGGEAPPAETPQCRDDHMGWYDDDGQMFNCAWYSVGDRCSRYGHDFENFFSTANDACCACDGGIVPEETCSDTWGWYGSDGPTFDCEWYAQEDTYCALFGHKHENMGKTANEACCTCGGGQSFELSYELVKEVMTKKGYKFFTGAYDINLVGIRSANRKAGAWDDVLLVLYEDKDGIKKMDKFEHFTTDPGKYYLKHPIAKTGCAIAKAGQYRGVWKFGKHKGKYDALVQTGKISVHRQNNKKEVLDMTSTVETGSLFGINLHHGKNSASIGKYSDGCQVLRDVADLSALLSTCRKQVDQGLGDSFTYTLLDEADVGGSGPPEPTIPCKAGLPSDQKSGTCKKYSECANGVAIPKSPGCENEPSDVFCCIVMPGESFLPPPSPSRTLNNSVTTKYDELEAACVERTECTGAVFHYLCPVSEGYSSTDKACVNETTPVWNVETDFTLTKEVYNKTFPDIAGTARGDAFFPYLNHAIVQVAMNAKSKKDRCLRVAAFVANHKVETAGKMYFSEEISFESKAYVNGTWRGRGAMHLTGVPPSFNNYESYSKYLKDPEIFDHPESVAFQAKGYLTGVMFILRKCNAHLGKKDRAGIDALTKCIQGGDGAADTRWKYFEEISKELGCDKM